MNIVPTLLLSICFILLGVNRIINIKRNTLALCEVVEFINFVKNNIRFSSMNYENLVENAKKENYSFIEFENEITLSKYAGEKYRKEFLNFTEKIGTTDNCGQISICDEYIEKFKSFYNECQSSEKGKVNVVGAISVLSVVCVLVLGG